MTKLSAAQRRYIENAVIFAASRLIFKSLENEGTPCYQINDIATTTSGGTPDRSFQGYYGGSIPWIKSGELNDGIITSVEEFISEEGMKNSSAKIYPKGTLLIALYGATVGKIGILDIAAASNQAVCAIYPKDSNLITRYLFWYLRSKREDLLKSSIGGAQPNISQKFLRETYVPVPSIELQEAIDKFLSAVEQHTVRPNIIIPDLPFPLQSIKGIVTRIDALAKRIAEARGLREDVAVDYRKLLFSEFTRITENVDWKPMSEVAPLVRRPVIVQSSAIYKELGVRSFNKGTFHKPQINGLDLGTKKIFYIEPGDLLFNIVFAWEGAVAVAKKEDHGRVGSHRFLSCIPVQGQSTSQFLNFYFSTNHGLQQLGEASPGGAGRNRTLAMASLANIKVPIPPIDQQLWFERLINKVDVIKTIQAETQAELDAMLPSVLDKAFRGEL